MPALADETWTLFDAEHYGRYGPPYSLWARMRSESPVHWCDSVAALEPFWAIARHEDVCRVSSQPELFRSGAGVILEPRKNPGVVAPTPEPIRVVISTDPPFHRKLRKVASPWFTPRALRSIGDAVEASARRVLDELGESGEADLVSRVATSHPLRVLSSALGVPARLESRILELTNQLFTPEDPDLGAGATDVATRQAMMREFFEMFRPIIEDRRARPTNDLASVLSNGQVDGAPMQPGDILGYFLIVFSAGHDTTKNSLAGGIAALIENPDEFRKLQKDPGLAPDAAEEVVRWTTPVNYQKRTATRDVELGGSKIGEGDAVVLLYGSANRDESVFEDASQFKIERRPNRHLGFGYGEHFCLGAHMARASQRALLRQLAGRVHSWELTSPPRWMQSGGIVGLKNLNVRYRIRPDR